MTATRGPVYVPLDGRPLADHETAAHHWVTRRLGRRLVPDGRYLVPSDTLDAAQASELDIHGVDQFFGGIVPYPFVGTKLMSHPLVASRASAPPGWRHRHPDRLSGLVVPGWGAFSLADLHEAAGRLFRGGSIRIKLAQARGGRSQWVVQDEAALRLLIERESALATGLASGIVVERDLREPVTMSVGYVVLPAFSLSYLGYQRAARDRHGIARYGGSRLRCARGGLSLFLETLADPRERLALAQAMAYHEAMLEAFPELVVSRANYDVIQGYDAKGHWHSGVLEQSWRIGGASPAEIVAAELLASAGRQPVEVAYVECYEADAAPPAGAEAIYRAPSPSGGTPTLTYVKVESR
ncbi:DUF3182 family protein [Dyella sedimenti]|uniref:DUF3182 family protein n=1 Tax=Dyella sedimenti TaxID=2919947 RepID=UPI001FAA1185|nr:DUF3182 family protein [Dyella sedimenti]